VVAVVVDRIVILLSAVQLAVQAVVVAVAGAVQAVVVPLAHLARGMQAAVVLQMVRHIEKVAVGVVPGK
jgi:hypothetical protein